jgi:hypothetical protein
MSRVASAVSGPVPELTRIRLSVAKRTFETGRGLVTRGDEVGRIQAAILIDQGVELALKALVDRAGIVIPGKNGQPETRPRFQQMVAATTSLVPSGSSAVPHHDDVRNPAYHHGVVPALSQLEVMAREDFAAIVECFAASGCAYSTFTLVPLVRNASMRNALDNAESALRTGDSLGALRWVRRAHRWLRHVVGFAAAATFGVPTYHGYDPEAGLSRVGANADGRGEATMRLLDVFAGAAMDFDLGAQLRLAEVLVNADDASATPTPDDVWWALDCVSAQAYRVERSIPQVIELSPGSAGPTGRFLGPFKLRFDG